jgi:hypothetical protein
VQTAGPRAAIDALRGLPGVVSVEPSGAVLHLFLAPALASTESLRQAIAGKGMPEVGFRQIEPSLEDVFIALVRKADLRNLATPNNGGSQ